MAYETAIGELLPLLFYPHLDFAAVQSRTDSGSVIRDLIFYNGQQEPFLKDIAEEYGSRQIVFEIKNVRDISRDHVNQLNRYMTDSLGRFGVLVTRNPLSKARMQSTVDLWAGQRRCIIALDDMDVSQMVEVFESKQRDPIDVLKKKYVDYRRACPGWNMPMILEEVEKLEKVSGQMDGLHKEISALARKSPNDGVNKFKLKFINAAISEANAVLGGEYKPFDQFHQFDFDDLPSNSEWPLCLANILKSWRKRADNLICRAGSWIYDLLDSTEQIRTAPPKKISEKK